MGSAFQRQSAAWPRQRGRVAVWGLVGVLALLALAALTFGFGFGRDRAEPPKPKSPAIVPVISGVIATANVPVKVSANGTVTALQSVDVRAQISATIKSVHIREGQFVRQGERLFSLDVRTEDANLGKAQAQVSRSRTDLANAERNLQRQRELFDQKFISQTALDTVQNQVDSLRAQVMADQASVESNRVTRGFGEMTAPIAGRTGAITVYPGSLVQPAGAPLVTITQIDPIAIAFTLPERELPAVQSAMVRAEVAVGAQLDEAGQPTRQGRLAFVDNSVDTSSGTIRLKAHFANADGRLWPGMFATLSLSPRTHAGALTVPVQAVQTGPEKKFLYVIGDQGKVSIAPVRVLLIQDGRAVIEGIGGTKGTNADVALAAGTRVVVEGAQNLRPGSTVSEATAVSATSAGGDATKPARKPGKP